MVFMALGVGAGAVRDLDADRAEFAEDLGPFFGAAGELAGSGLPVDAVCRSSGLAPQDGMRAFHREFAGGGDTAEDLLAGLRACV